jgi:hypothetical protein
MFMFVAGMVIAVSLRRVMPVHEPTATVWSIASGIPKRAFRLLIPFFAARDFAPAIRATGNAILYRRDAAGGADGDFCWPESGGYDPSSRRAWSGTTSDLTIARLEAQARFLPPNHRSNSG